MKSGIYVFECIYSVPADMPLYDILNEFQKGSSHMAVVMKAKGKGKTTLSTDEGPKNEENQKNYGDSQLTTPLLEKQRSDTFVVDIDKHPKKQSSMHDVTGNGLLPEDIENEVIGIITLEDVFEELLQVNHSPLRFLFFHTTCSYPPQMIDYNFFIYSGGDRR